jgi:Domain of unknown function (DUF4247)
VVAVTRGRLLLLAGALATGGAGCLVGSVMISPSISSYLGDNYGAAGSNRYHCTGSPGDVADDIAEDQPPEARTTDAKTNTEYLRYDNNIVTVGKDANQGCSIQLQSLNDGYNQGHYTYLGPGFYPGSPASSSGGSSGGPGGIK